MQLAQSDSIAHDRELRKQSSPEPSCSPPAPSKTGSTSAARIWSDDEEDNFVGFGRSFAQDQDAAARLEKDDDSASEATVESDADEMVRLVILVEEVIFAVLDRECSADYALQQPRVEPDSRPDHVKPRGPRKESSVQDGASDCTGARDEPKEGNISEVYPSRAIEPTNKDRKGGAGGTTQEEEDEIRKRTCKFQRRGLCLPSSL